MNVHRLEGLLKYRSLGPTYRASGSVGLGQVLGICLSNRFPGDAAAAGPGTTLCLLNAVVGKITAPEDVHVLVTPAPVTMLC